MLSSFGLANNPSTVQLEWDHLGVEQTLKKKCFISRHLYRILEYLTAGYTLSVITSWSRMYYTFLSTLYIAYQLCIILGYSITSFYIVTLDEYIYIVVLQVLFQWRTLRLVESSVDSITRESLPDIRLNAGRDTHTSIDTDPSADSKKNAINKHNVLLYHKQR